MRNLKYLFVVPLIILSTVFCEAQALRISMIYPAGGQRGTRFEVLIGGRNVNRTRGIIVSGKGVNMRIVQGATGFRLNEESERTVVRDHFQKAVDRLYAGAENPPFFGPNPIDRKSEQEKAELPKLENIMKRRLWLDLIAKDSPLSLDEQRRVLQEFYTNYFIRPMDASLPEPIGNYLRVEVAIDDDAPIGRREVTLVLQNGLTMPAYFYVSPCREVREIEPNEPETKIGQLTAQKRNQKKPGKDNAGNGNAGGNGGRGRRMLDWVRVQLPTQDLPVVFNGQIRAGDLDMFSFNAKKGQKLVLVAWGRALSPYLADGVPGWFSPVCSVFDSNMQLLQTADSWRFDSDPVMLFDVPEDGVYHLEVRDALYRGRDDFVYRLAVGEFPFVTSRATLGIVDDKPIAISGWNLPVKTVTPPKKDANGNSRKTFVLDTLDGQWLPHPVVFPTGTLPTVVESRLRKNPGDAKELPITLPVVVEGRIGKPHEIDSYTFQGKKDEQIVVDVTAVSLDSTLDANVELLDANGKVLAANDDRANEKGPNIGMETHHADPYLTSKLPEDGRYTVRILNVLGTGDASCAYRMRVSNPRPDFIVYATPSNSTARANTILLEFTAIRKDGFKGEIKLGAKDGAPLAIHAGTIPAGLDKLECTVSVEGTLPQPTPYALYATATIDGRKVTRQVVPADELEQAFIYYHLVPRQTLRVIKPFRGPYTFTGGRQKTVTLEYGKTTALSWQMSVSPYIKKMMGKNGKDGSTFGAGARFEVAEPKGVNVKDWSFENDVLKISIEPVKSDDPGMTIPPKGNIIVNLYAKAQGKQTKKDASEQLRDQLPSIPYRLDVPRAKP